MNDNQFDPESDYDQLGLLAHRAVTTQLHILAEQAGDDPQACYSLICGALAGIATYALAIAKPDAHRDMQAHIQSIVPWAFDQAAGATPTPRADA